MLGEDVLVIWGLWERVLGGMLRLFWLVVDEVEVRFMCLGEIRGGHPLLVG